LQETLPSAHRVRRKQDLQASAREIREFLQEFPPADGPEADVRAEERRAALQQLHGLNQEINGLARMRGSPFVK